VAVGETPEGAWLAWVSPGESDPKPQTHDLEPRPPPRISFCCLLNFYLKALRRERESERERARAREKKGRIHSV
jgi:hypothetical protein